MRSHAWGCLVWCALACGGAPEPVAEVAEDDRVARLVSLSPAITETIGVLGGLERLVGRSDWCTSPEGVRALPSFGSVLSPSLEGLVQVQPATLLVDQSLGADLGSLAAVGPLEVLPWLSREDVVRSVGRLGEILDRKTEAAALADRLQAGLSDTPPADPAAPRVLLVLGAQGPAAGDVWYVKRNSLHGAALHAAGARNAVDRDVAGAPSLSLEALLALDPPHIVVLSATPVAREDVVAGWSALAPLTAVREEQIQVISGPHALAPGPSILKLVAELRSVLHTEVAP